MKNLKSVLTHPIAWSLEIALFCLCQPVAGAEVPLRAVPFDNGVLIADWDGLFLAVRPTAWDGSWHWLPGKLAKDGDSLAAVHDCKIGDEPVRLAVRITPAPPRRIELSYEFTVERNFSPNMIAVSIDAGVSFRGKGHVQIATPAGQTAFALPMPGQAQTQKATAICLTNTFGTTTLHLDPCIDLRGGAAIQLLLGQGKFVPGQPRKLKVSIELPADYKWGASPAELPDEPGSETWFPWQPDQDVEGDESAIGMQAWLDPIKTRAGPPGSRSTASTASASTR